MPDANKENTLNQLVGAAFGAAGQRCMALSTAILVGEAKKWLPELVERAKNLRVNAGNQLSASLFTLCICGAKLLVLSLACADGSNHVSSYHCSSLYCTRCLASSLLGSHNLCCWRPPTLLCCFTGDQPGADLGPLITPQAKERVCNLIDSGTKEGASILLDGRKIKVKGYENGNFVGPTIISNVKVNNSGLFISQTWELKAH